MDTNNTFSVLVKKKILLNYKYLESKIQIFIE